MSNLYEILEVSNKASKEVIDKAYHVLAKKYHPDLQANDEQRRIAEEKMKKINEAYDVLSNEQKRKVYDLKLMQENEEAKRKLDEKKLNDLQNVTKKKININNQDNQNLNQTYQRYTSYFKGIKRSKKEPWTKERFLGLLKALGIFIIIILILWFFPATHNMLVKFYDNNIIIKQLVDIIARIFVGIINGIIQFFKIMF